MRLFDNHFPDHHFSAIWYWHWPVIGKKIITYHRCNVIASVLGYNIHPIVKQDYNIETKMRVKLI